MAVGVYEAPPQPPPLVATLFICCFVLEECKSADSKAAVGSPGAVSTAKRRSGRQKKAQSTEGREKNKHRRPVMQKHRFNVRLASRISSGGRKKLVWTDRKGAQRLAEEEAEA